MRRPLFGGNWKMHKDLGQTESFLQDFVNRPYGNGVDVVLFPAFPNLALAKSLMTHTSLELGAQNLHPQPRGAFTGEVSSEMLSACGVQWVLVGHSERRSLFLEKDDFLALKVRTALDHKFKPMLCVGETLEEREAGDTASILTRQTRVGLQHVEASEIAGMAIAYEPVWAIGTGKSANAADAESGCRLIRKVVEQQYGSKASEAIRIVYGGSVKAHNIGEYMQQHHVDGGLVGGASLEAADFSELIQNGLAK